MGDGECQTQASVLVNGTATVFATHPANWSKPCKSSDKFLLYYLLVKKAIPKIIAIDQLK